MARRDDYRHHRPNNHEYDDQYLFRLVSTFGWDDAVSFCDRLISELEHARAKCRRIRRVARRRDADRDDGTGAEGEAHEYRDDDGMDYDQDDEGDDDGSHDDRDTTRGSLDGGGDAPRLRLRLRLRRQFLAARRHLNDRMRIARDRLYYRDQWRNTPLHAASYVKPPLDVVMGHCVLEAAVAMATTTTTNTTTNGG